MKFTKALTALSLLVPGLLFTSFCLNPKPEVAGLNAGFAKVNITPTQPVRMSGYDARSEPFKGVHDDLFVSAAVFENGDIKICIITADVIGFSHMFTDEVRSLIEKETGVSAMNVMITAAHNHSGPITGVYTKNISKPEADYIRTLQEKIVRAAKIANESLQPVRIGTGKGSCKMNINRRARHGDGGIWLGRNPSGICDHEVGVIRFDDLSGNTIGLMINWPCHATTGGQENYQITGDWPGATARNVEQSYPDAVVMVSAGASGDINPIYGPNDNFNDINAMGAVLSEEVLRVAQSIETAEAGNLKIANSMITAKGKKRSESRMPNVSLEPNDSVVIKLAAVKIGNNIIVGISGELMNEIGLDIKADSPFKNTFIYTHCNGSSGYLCTDKAYIEGGYEPMVARTMPGTEALIKDALKKLINEL